MTIKVLTTGGTIDKIYFDAKSEFQVGDPQIVDLLRESNVGFQFEVESIMKKDSLDMTEEDRERIRLHVQEDACNRILITHGTDTMVKTANALLGIEGKTIVLTGSMQPARLRVSDAIFNIGYAVAAAQLLDAGVHIAMNGCVFDPRTARKNVEMHCFEQIAEN